MRAVQYTTYKDFYRARDIFLDPHEPMDLIIVGIPGLGKTQAFKRSLDLMEGEDFGYISGNVSAFDMYRQLYPLKDKPVVLDDVDDALKDAKKKTLLKGLMENEKLKVARWNTASTQLIDEWGGPIPRSFATRSTFAIIVNSLNQSFEAHFGALVSRAYVIEFAPSPEEVHRYAGEWFKERDEEVYDFLGRLVPIITRPDVRYYEKARKLKYHKDAWKRHIFNAILGTNPDLNLIVSLMLEPSLDGEDEKAMVYAQRSPLGYRHYVQSSRMVDAVIDLKAI